MLRFDLALSITIISLHGCARASDFPSEGIYAVANLNSGKVLNVKENGMDNGDDVWQWDNPENPSSQWQLTKVTSDTYTFTNVNSGKVLNVEQNGMDDGDNVWQWDNPTLTASQWRLKLVGTGKRDIYVVTNVNSGRVLNVEQNSVDNGANVWQWDDPENPSSQWTFIPLSPTTTLAPPPPPPPPVPTPTPSPPPVPTPPPTPTPSPTPPSPTPPPSPQMWDGWGISLAWWTKLFGDRDDIADAIFSCKDSVTVWGQYNVPGLCLNLVRYNAGGSAWRSFDGMSMVASPHIPGYKQIEGYWQDSHSDDPSSSSWDWSVDLKQRTAMQKAKERGANKFELFSNSPMWWMLKNHNPSGASDGGDNLDDSHYDDHAKYLATIAAYAKDNWGISFDSVEPMNEPGSNWWKADGTQEGCGFSVGASQARIVAALRSELDKRNLSAIVAASDENDAPLALGSWTALGVANATQHCGGFNFHGYQNSAQAAEIAARVSLAVGTKSKRVWNTEYGDNDVSGQTLANEISMDMTYLKPTAWTHWQAVDGSGWGLFELGGSSIVGVNQKYYVLAQHSRHVKAGMQILEHNYNGTVMAYDKKAARLAIVVHNHGFDEVMLKYDLSRFATVRGPIARWATDFQGEQRYARRGALDLEDATLAFVERTLSVRVPAMAVATFEIENVLPGDFPVVLV